MEGEAVNEFIYPELSYQIIGILYSVYNELGPEYREIFYERAVEKSFRMSKLFYKRQLPYTVTFRGQIVGKHYFDFLVDNKIILELKVGDHFSRRNIHQANEYLKASKLKLALLANFTSKGVKIKRIVNII
ncbi:MAG: hypothetical protein A3H70_04335 [Candidatus Komeilibacteria bacterium RIFCSPLOWO2_02_FULL_48_11]|uniref:GxxExxY protein n=1 Tax=Candidatus Komeilibacteria bacterium RIFCSPLOWO2_02_FULL_48_11 TaxID=1798553 RepID=A0A1G2BR91_9BACT|nr:MAG: hypothetical protein A3H70_04335 [Candidatus Komeilibacteria bacterium RIFCSPLOWO2_02_FULL_48_11]